jgi:hypothetical protein
LPSHAVAPAKDYIFPSLSSDERHHPFAMHASFTNSRRSNKGLEVISVAECLKLLVWAMRQAIISKR